jgi:rubredoxin
VGSDSEACAEAYDYNRGRVEARAWVAGGSAETECELKKYMCLICGWIYDEATGAPDEGIAPGTRWEDVPPNWTCPECGARKEDFEMIEI